MMPLHEKSCTTSGGCCGHSCRCWCVRCGVGGSGDMGGGTWAQHFLRETVHGLHTVCLLRANSTGSQRTNLQSRKVFPPKSRNWDTKWHVGAKLVPAAKGVPSSLCATCAQALFFWRRHSFSKSTLPAFRMRHHHSGGLVIHVHAISSCAKGCIITAEPLSQEG